MQGSSSVVTAPRTRLLALAAIAMLCLPAGANAQAGTTATCSVPAVELRPGFVITPAKQGSITASINATAPDGSPVTSATTGQAVLVSVSVVVEGDARENTSFVDVSIAGEKLSLSQLNQGGLVSAPPHRFDQTFPLTPTSLGDLPIAVNVNAIYSDSTSSLICAPKTTATLVIAVKDTRPPSITNMKPVTATIGRPALFRYRTGDESGTTVEVIAIYRENSRRPIATFTTKWANVGSAGVRWKVPTRFRPGSYVWCAVSKDPSENVSPARCARLTLRG
jgi:hypothetical protein